MCPLMGKKDQLCNKRFGVSTSRINYCMAVEDEIAQSRREKPLLQNDAQLLPRQESGRAEIKDQPPCSFAKVLRTGNIFLVKAKP